MIARALSFLLLLYVLGFVFFAVTLGKPAPPDTPVTDAAVVLTGGGTLTLGDLLLLALLPFGLTALATWVARTTVLAALRQSV